MSIPSQSISLYHFYCLLLPLQLAAFLQLPQTNLSLMKMIKTISNGEKMLLAAVYEGTV